MKKIFYKFLFLFVGILFLNNISFAQYSIYETYDLNKVQFSISDFGNMWTFDDIPFTQWGKRYGFQPTQEWLDYVQKSALQFENGCSAAFISEDGLIMTNHHCGRGDLHLVQKDGEDLLRDGFYAPTPDQERTIPDLYVDQLILIEDVTKEMHNAMNAGKTDQEKIENRNKKRSDLIFQYEKKTGLTCRVITLYNGRKFSLYGYKRYTDIRLVMVPDFQIAATGWDWDNFTYPRYELDFAFYRAYDENGNPVKVKDHFTWSKSGASEGELIFTVGRPGNTDRLLSVAELEFLRDKRYPYTLLMYNEVYKVYYELFQKYTDRESELLNSVMRWGNARKSYAGSLLGLRDQFMMAKKKDFEKQLIEAVKNDTELNKKYGQIWESLRIVSEELKNIADEFYAYRLPSFIQPVYSRIAADVVKYAEQMRLAESEREDDYKGDKVAETVKKIVDRVNLNDYEKELNFILLRAQINYLVGILGSDNELINKMFGSREDENAVQYILDKSLLTSKESIDILLKKTPDEILKSEDPFIYFLQTTTPRRTELEKLEREVRNTLAVNNQLLGEAVSAVFGDMISPDATGTLRISDGLIKGYEYNGTIAPGKTTFYGLYDRYISFGKKLYPWGLHPRWQNPPAEFNLGTTVGFASTNDIVGGNSGSSVINAKGEVVGLVHDGNLESLAGYFIFLPENNRCVASDSEGLIAALKYIYKTDKLLQEILTGKLAMN